MTNNEKQLILGDLLPGDVLVMQGAQNVSWPTIIAEGDMDAALIQAIMWLTNSDVCHGAIYYGDVKQSHSLIDDGEKGVGQHGMSTGDGKPDTWYVRRMNGVETLQPVLALAMKYKGEKTAYDWELLTLLGLLLIYQKVTPNNTYYQGVLAIMEKLVVSLDSLTHNTSTKYFVCSQFVAACFDQAGSAYELDLVNGNLSTQSMTEGVSVIDHCVSHMSLNPEPQTFSSMGLPLKVEDLKLLVEPKDEAPSSQKITGDEQVRMNQACDQFLKLFYSLNAKTLGLSADQYETAKQRLLLAQKYQADFVTPADLKSHCKNLTPIGMIEFVYGKAMP